MYFIIDYTNPNYVMNFEMLVSNSVLSYTSDYTIPTYCCYCS